MIGSMAVSEKERERRETLDCQLQATRMGEGMCPRDSGERGRG